MKTISIIAAAMMAASVAPVAAQEVTQYYDTLATYYVTTDAVKLERGDTTTLKLKLTNPAAVGQVFQVDVQLPAGLTPGWRGDTLQCLPAGGVVVDSRYYRDDNSLRLLVNADAQIAKNKGQFATLEVVADSTFEAVGEVAFSGLIFYGSDNKGHYGADKAAKATPLIYVESLTLAEHEMTVVVTATRNMVATVQPTNATEQGVTWKSEKPWIAEITSSGYMRARSLGTTMLIATSKENSALADTCVITVIPRTKSLKLKKASRAVTLDPGADFALQWTVEPSAMKDRVQFASSDTAVVTVDQQGNVHAVAPGQAVVAVQSTDGSNLIAMSTITVSGPETEACDVDGNGLVDIDDLNMVVNRILRKAQEAAQLLLDAAERAGADDDAAEVDDEPATAGEAIEPAAGDEPATAAASASEARISR